MKMTYRLEGLECAACAAKMERAAAKLDGVTSAAVNFMAQKMVIEGDEGKADEITKSAEAIVKKIEPHVKVKRV